MKLYRVLLPVLGLLVLASITSASTRTISLGSERSSLTLVEQRDDALVYEVQVGGIEAVDVATVDGEFTRLILPGFHHSMGEGEPELPMMNRLVAIPVGATTRVEIVPLSSRTVNLADYGITDPIFPAQPSMSKSADPATTPFIYDRAAYQVPHIARERAAMIDLGTLRAVRLGRLEISPVEYVPAEGRLVVHDRMEVRIRFEGGDRAAGEQIAMNTYSPFFKGVYERIDGYRGQHALHPDLVREIVTMAIVTPPAYEAQLQTFIDWKKLRGFNVIVGVTGTPEVGTTTSSIRTWLHNLYNNGTPTQPAPSFVLFVGDTNVMPTWLEDGDATDRPYCSIGADMLPEMYYGRFSCSNSSNLQAIIDKTLMYDQFTMPDPSYLGKVVMIAGMDSGHGQTWANGQINYGTQNYFNTAHGIYSYTHLYPNSGGQASQIIQEVSQGVGFVNYTAHGSETSWSDPSFTQSNVNSLANNGEYCLAVGNCCLTSDYDYGTECFAETWLRAANKGAIGYIGGSNSTYWDEDYYFGVGYRASIVEHPVFDPAHMGGYDGLFHDHNEEVPQWYVTNDALIFCGNLAVTESGSGLTSYYWTIYNLMGDPSLSCYLGVPAENPVTHPATIMIGWTSIEITAAPNSYCGLTKDGVLVGAGTTDANGGLTLPIWTEILPGTAHLCVTAQNREPYQADIQVITPSGPYLILESKTVDDQQFGDGDSGCDAGETVDLQVMLKNVGVAATTTGTALLSSSDPFAFLDPTQVALPGLAPGVSGTTDVPFGLTVSGSVPDLHSIPFHLEATSPEGSWAFDFALTAQAPVLQAGAAFPDDAPPLGDGDGVVEPGESFRLQPTLLNSGHGDALDLTGTLSCDDPNIVVTLAEGTCGQVPAGGEGVIGTFEVQVLPGCPSPSMPLFHLALAGPVGFAAMLPVEVPVGPWFDDAEAHRGWTLGAPDDNATGGLWVRAEPVGTAYQGQQSQPEYDHTADPASLCFVTGNAAVGGLPGDADVDGGKTTLLSPIFNAAGATGATISYWRWFTNNLGTNPGTNDYWSVDVTTDGTTWVHLEHTTTNANQWTYHAFDLSAFVPLTGTLQFRFVAEDQEPVGLVEAALDDITISIVRQTSSEVSSEPVPVPVTGIVSCRPNPLHHGAMVTYRLGSREPVRIELYDTAGRRVRELWNGTREPGEHALAFRTTDQAGRALPSGVYFVRMATAGKTEVRQVTVLR